MLLTGRGTYLVASLRIDLVRQNQTFLIGVGSAVVVLFVRTITIVGLRTLPNIVLSHTIGDGLLQLLWSLLCADGIAVALGLCLGQASLYDRWQGR